MKPQKKLVQRHGISIVNQNDQQYRGKKQICALPESIDFLDIQRTPVSLFPFLCSNCNRQIPISAWQHRDTNIFRSLPRFEHRSHQMGLYRQATEEIGQAFRLFQHDPTGVGGVEVVCAKWCRRPDTTDPSQDRGTHESTIAGTHPFLIRGRAPTPIPIRLWNEPWKKRRR